MADRPLSEDLGSESIHPRLDKTTFFAPTEEGPAKQFHEYSGGFTKREYVAIAVMSGMYANPNIAGSPEQRANEAVHAADALLKELAK